MHNIVMIARNYLESGPRLGWRNSLIPCRRGSASADGIETPVLRLFIRRSENSLRGFDCD